MTTDTNDVTNTDWAAGWVRKAGVAVRAATNGVVDEVHGYLRGALGAGVAPTYGAVRDMVVAYMTGSNDHWKATSVGGYLVLVEDPQVVVDLGEALVTLRCAHRALLRFGSYTIARPAAAQSFGLHYDRLRPLLTRLHAARCLPPMD